MSSLRQRRKPPFEESSVTSGTEDGIIESETTENNTEFSENEDFSLEGTPEAEDSDSDPEDLNPETISGEIIDEIEEGIYICLVCTCEIDRNSKIWSCKSCYRVYDLDCIKDWALRGSSTTEQKSWRCPSCNIEHHKIPSSFTCWCGKVSNPKNDSLIPFSCGNLCSKKYPNCVHSCTSVCHPGRHPACGALGPVMSCKCGKHQQQLPCLATPYKTGWRCDEPCDTTVCSLGHKCSVGACHLGFCGACNADVESRCYCGKNTRKVKCHDLEPRLCADGDNGKFVGSHKCKDTTVQYYDCGIHYEQLQCQPLPSTRPHCSLSPDTVTTCYCGKTPATSLNREKCTDPMPECDNVCGKKMPCGCQCQMKCHPGPCECFNVLSVPCDCGFSSFLATCKALRDGFKPKCKRKCLAAMSCRRHLHREYCCPYEKVAYARGRELRKKLKSGARVRRDDVLQSMEAVHICLQPCNRVKKCGKHRCEAYCHSGKCNPCLESSSEDLVCHCGKTVVPAPVRCGTKVDCHEQCVREKPCGHRQEPHECHDESEKCPRCTKGVDKVCNCGERTIKNVMCSIETVSCGKLCTVKKDCGHPCNRPCSKDCVNGIHASSDTCVFQCRKVRRNCPHVCFQRCHHAKGVACDSFTCKNPVLITCLCGRMTKEVLCGATMVEPSKIGHTMECDSECVQAKREAELREIFSLSSKPSENPYSDVVLNTYKKQPNWCRKMEGVIRDFVSDYVDLVAAGGTPKKARHFPPMNKPQRAFIHELAGAFHLYSESQDKEPMRSVFICVTGITKTPLMTVENALNREERAEYKKQALADLQESQIDNMPCNAVLIKDVFFGIKEETVRDQAMVIAGTEEGLDNPKVAMTEAGQFVFTADSFRDMTKEKEDQLFRLLRKLKHNFREKLIAFDCRMCLVDDDVTQVLKVDHVNVMASTSVLPEPAAKPLANAYEVLNTGD